MDVSRGRQGSAGQMEAVERMLDAGMRCGFQTPLCAQPQAKHQDPRGTELSPVWRNSQVKQTQRASFPMGQRVPKEEEVPGLLLEELGYMAVENREGLTRFSAM